MFESRSTKGGFLYLISPYHASTHRSINTNIRDGDLRAREMKLITYQ